MCEPYTVWYVCDWQGMWLAHYYTKVRPNPELLSSA